MENDNSHRRGDTIQISGDYQFKAITSGNPVQKFWHQKKFDEAERWLNIKPKDVALDVGCGSAVLAGQLATNNPQAEIIGIDTNDQALEFCNAHYKQNNLSFRKGYVDDLSFPNESVSQIAFLEVIEHINEDQGLETLKGFHRILKPSGRLVITTPNYFSLWPLIETTCDLLKLVPQMAEEQHVSKYTRKRLKRVCHKAGFNILESRSSHFIAPWLNILNNRAALEVHKIEQKVSHGLGSLLLFVLEKPGESQ